MPTVSTAGILNAQDREPCCLLAAERRRAEDPRSAFALRLRLLDVHHFVLVYRNSGAAPTPSSTQRHTTRAAMLEALNRELVPRRRRSNTASPRDIFAPPRRQRVHDYVLDHIHR